MAAENARLAALSVLVLGLMAVLHPWLAPRRPAPVELRAPREIVVTSSADAGPGSLREAIVDAGSAAQRVRIVCATPSIVLQDPLPPLVNPRGIVIDAADDCVIEAGQLLTGGAFQVAAPDSALSGLSIRGAPSYAVLVRADRVRLRGLEVTDSGDGVRVAEGVGELIVEDSRFRANAVGLRSFSDRAGTVVRNHFSLHEDAAIWAVRPRPRSGVSQAGGLRVTHNHFVEDRISLVVGNLPVTVENNEIVAAFEAAVYITGRGAVVRDNRIRAAARFGIRGEAVHGGLVVGNEIGHNQVAVLLQAARDTVVDGNRIYGDGDGIAIVFGDPAGPSTLSANLLLGHRGDGVLLVGSSPVVRDNRALGNQRAALRLLDFVPASGATVVSRPRLEANVFADNGTDQEQETYLAVDDGEADQVTEEER